MLMICKDFEDAKRMLSVAMAEKYPNDFSVAIFVDDGIKKGYYTDNSVDNVNIKRTLTACYNTALELLQDIFSTVKTDDLYCVKGSGIKLEIENKEENDNMDVNRFYFSVDDVGAVMAPFIKAIKMLDNPDIKIEENKEENDTMDMKDFTLSDKDIETMTSTISASIKDKAAEVYALNKDVGQAYISEMLDAATIGANAMYDLMLDKIVKAVKAEKQQPTQPVKPKKEKSVYGADEVFNYLVDRKIGKESLTIDEIAELLEELFN